METNQGNNNSSKSVSAKLGSASEEQMLLAALERNDTNFETGRYLITFKEGAGKEALTSLATQSMHIADARDFEDQALKMESVADADAVLLPEIGVAIVSSEAARERNIIAQSDIGADSPIKSIDPEYFVFGENGPVGSFNGNSFGERFNNPVLDNLTGFDAVPKTSSEYLRGFMVAANAIANDLQAEFKRNQPGTEEEAQVFGATWGLNVCRVPASRFSGVNIKIAILGTGMDTGHPDFAGRTIVGQTFVGQPVIGLHGDTHIIGTSCGPLAPAGFTPRYGIAYRSSIFVGKVLTNQGAGTQAAVLAGFNWAIANRCQVILASFGSGAGVNPVYTAVGQAALNNNCLIIAPAGSSGGGVGAPANSPTIVSVAALDQLLRPSAFSSFGKIDIAAPGVDIFSSAPRPGLYRNGTGTTSAAAHVAGCAALLAQSDPNLRGLALLRRLQSNCRRLPFPAARVGSGLVQAP